MPLSALRRTDRHRAQGESVQGTAALPAGPPSDSRSLQSAQRGLRTEIFLEAPFHVESCPPHLFLPTPWCFPGPEKRSGDLGPGDLVTGAPALPASFLPQDGDSTKGHVSDHAMERPNCRGGEERWECLCRLVFL